MKKVFLAIRSYDVEGYRIAGIFETREEAEAAARKSAEDGYGTDNEVHELPVGVYFDINDIGL